MEYLRSKDWDRAELEFRFSLERDASFAPAHFGLASLYFRKAEYKTAEFYIDRALNLEPEWAKARLLKGRILFEKGDYKNALKYFNETQVGHLNGSSKSLISEITSWKGMTYQQLGELEKAKKYLTLSLKLNPANQETIHAMQFQNMIQSFKSKSEVRFRKILTSGMITRSEWAWLLAKEFSINGNPSAVTPVDSKIPLPPDVPNDFWAEKQILQVLQDKMFFIFPDGTFLPQRKLRRAEVAITYKNLKENYQIKSEKLEEVKHVTINDLPEWHPLFTTVEEAIELGLMKLDPESNIQMNATVSGKDALTALFRLKQIFNYTNQ